MILLYLAILGVASSLIVPPADFFKVLRRPWKQLQVFLAQQTTERGLDNTSSSSPASLLVDWAKPSIDLPDQPEEVPPSKRVNFVHLLGASGEVDLSLSPLKRQIAMLSERCLKSDISLGIAEGVIFEVCKVLVDLTAPLTGIHVSHALNSRQDEASYLVRGLMQEIMLNAVGPSIGVDPSYRNTAPTALAQPAGLAPSSSSAPANNKALSVSLHVDLDALPALPAQSAEAKSSFGPILLEMPHDLQTQQQQQATKLQSMQEQQEHNETRPSREEIQERAKAIAQAQNARRQRVATIVILRSFVAPLLVHSLAHILPSYLSHELIEDLVEGAPL